MPIGTIIGFFIGAFICGIMLAVRNSGTPRKITEHAAIVRQTWAMIGTVTWLISLAALIGTFIEMGQS